MANKNFFMNGITDLLILLILRNGDSYTYELANTIKELSGGRLNLSLNTVYTVIYKLELEKHISEHPQLVGRKRVRVYYHLEPSGFEYAEELLTSYRNITDGVTYTISNICKMKGSDDNNE